MPVMHNRLQHLFFFCIFVVVLVAVFFIIQSFLAPLILAFALAIVFQPLYQYLKKRMGNHATLAALVTVVIILVVVLVPLFFIGQALFNEALSLYISVGTSGHGQTWFDQGIANLQTYLRAHVAPQITLNASDYIQQSLQWVVSRLNSFFTEFLRIAFETLIMVIALFYILRDGHLLRDQYLKISPLPDEYDERIIKTLSSAVGSVIKGSLIVAVLQAIQGSIAIVIAGYPSPIIWGIFIGIASFVPGVGTGVIMIPLIIFTFFIGHIVQGILLTVWYILAVTLIDNILSPQVLKLGGIKVHPFMILLGVIGGLVVFGPIGFIVGPLLMALFFALVELYPFVLEKT